jgi:hypothetical protein
VIYTHAWMHLIEGASIHSPLYGAHLTSMLISINTTYIWHGNGRNCSVFTSHLCMSQRPTFIGKNHILV